MQGTKQQISRFKAGDVVTTINSVTIRNKDGKADGRALPGWKWRIERLESRVPGTTIYTYHCTAKDAPGMYFATLKDSQIAGKV